MTHLALKDGLTSAHSCAGPQPRVGDGSRRALVAAGARLVQLLQDKDRKDREVVLICDLRIFPYISDITIVSRPVAVSPDRRGRRYCMNQPWLTTSDWPVRALLSNPAKKTAVSATSATVVNSPSTVSFSITFLMTSASEMPSSFACSGICLSTSGVRTKPGQMTLARTPCLAPSLATTLASPIKPCLAVT